MTEISNTLPGPSTLSQPLSQGTDPCWTGLGVVLGSGGIGTAVAATLRHRCPNLTLLVCGRQGPPRQDLYVDLEDDQSLESLATDLRERNLPLRLLFNCTGRLHGPDLMPEKRLQQVNRRQLLEQFSINAIAPVLLARSLEPLLKRDQPFHYASLSARVGSIGDNRSGGWYGYRAAKAAQNQLLRCLSIEWARRWPLATVTLFHPGTTDTALSRPFQSFVRPDALFSPERAAEQLVDLLLQQTPEQSGQFLAWDGQAVPW
ncbi:MAG: short-chain dehydrogenase [Cyanobium sp. NAT70]|nr:short-chain dehydrogenase [Cyanobium sp. NAT70]|tara:strand:+ start:3254 stop:4033 length:780 start_codon:yes stop_codon:yes gene_type:complete